MGSVLDWQRLDGKKATRAALFKVGADPSDPEAWPSQHEWMLTQMTKFKRSFAPRLKAMQNVFSVAAGVSEVEPEREA